MLASQTFLFNLDAQLLFDLILLALAVFPLFILMSYLLFEPTRKLLRDRKERVENDINSAKDDKEKAAALMAEYEAKLKGADKEIEKILSDARAKAKSTEAKIIAEAQEEAKRIKDQAAREAELEKKHAMDDVKTEMVQIASLMASKVVQNSINAEIQDSLVEETLREMGESTWQN